MRNRCPYCANEIKFTKDDGYVQCPDCATILENREGRLEFTYVTSLNGRK